MPGEGRNNNPVVRLNLNIMLTLEASVCVRIVQLESGPTPFPLSSGFNTSTAYRAIGMLNPSTTDMRMPTQGALRMVERGLELQSAMAQMQGPALKVVDAASLTAMLHLPPYLAHALSRAA